MSTSSAAKFIRLVVLVALAGFGVAAPALARHRAPSKPLTVRLHVRFHQAGTGANVLTDHPYIFVGAPASIMGPIGAVIDEQQASEGRFHKNPGCKAAADPLGGPWFLFDCGSAAELYSLAHGTWTTVMSNAALDCGGLPDCEISAFAAGADWIQFAEDQACEAHCGPTTFAFQNLQTSQIESLPAWKPGGTTIPDLNSPVLAHKLCWPLRVPNGEGLTLDGSFAIVAQSQGDFLERCGSRLHERIDPNYWPQTASSRAVIWGTGTSQMDGLFLPSLRRFTIDLPAAVAGFDGLSYVMALGSRKLYVANGSNFTLWTAPVPRLPRTRR